MLLKQGNRFESILKKNISWASIKFPSHELYAYNWCI